MADHTDSPRISGRGVFQAERTGKGEGSQLGRSSVYLRDSKEASGAGAE